MIDTKKFKGIYLSESEDHLQKLNDNLLKLEKNTTDKKVLDELMRSAHTMKSSSATMGYKKMAYLTHVLEDVFDYARHGLLDIAPSTIDQIFKSLDALDESLKSIREHDQEIELDNYSDAIKKITGVKTAGVGKSVRADDGKPVDAPASNHQGEKVEVATSSGDLKSKIEKISHIKVPVDRLDKLMDLTEELLIDRMKMQSVVGNTKKQSDNSFIAEIQVKDLIPKMRLTTEHLSNLISSLQYHVMQARLVPVGQIFARFPRMIRDLSHSQKKEIAFDIAGEDLELDRTIVDKLGDPLVHLLRNAVDHGIEGSGKINLTAEREKDFVTINVEDSGAGIDWASVIEAGRTRNIISDKQKESYLDSLRSENKPNRETKKLVFHPELSTNSEVTETSGRGVGLSVVHKFAESISGNIDIESPINSSGGTRFTLELPMTLAIINALLVKINKEVFAIPFSSIDRVVHVEKSHIKSMADQDIAIVNETDVPLVNLKKIFDLKLDKKLNPDKTKERKSGDDKGKEEGKKDKTIKPRIVVLVKRGKQIAGIQVDKLLTEEEIIVKPLPDVLRGIKGFSGSTILGDGETILILDVVSLLEDSHKLVRV
jgi:two-component system, chemotaxis family, sensor kinase CheA